jgi:hypothetical protein
MCFHGGGTKQVSLVGVSEVGNILATSIDPLANCIGEDLFSCGSIGHGEMLPL